jgi:hypothetical protein
MVIRIELQAHACIQVFKSVSLFHKLFLFLLKDKSVSTVVKKRAGNVIVTLTLLFSVILCIGTVYWYVLNNQNRDQPLKSKPNNHTESLSEESELVENLSLEEAFSDLLRDGCRIVNVKVKVYLDNPQYVSYNEFKLKALESQIVVASPSDSGTFLLVQIKSTQWVWIPS